MTSLEFVTKAQEKSHKYKIIILILIRPHRFGFRKILTPAESKVKFNQHVQRAFHPLAWVFSSDNHKQISVVSWSKWWARAMCKLESLSPKWVSEGTSHSNCPRLHISSADPSKSWRPQPFPRAASCICFYGQTNSEPDSRNSWTGSLLITVPQRHGPHTGPPEGLWEGPPPASFPEVREASPALRQASAPQVLNGLISSSSNCCGD